jgi:hypothetical protein
LGGRQKIEEAQMRHEPSKDFSFELPDGWRRDERNLTITFFGPEGGLGSKQQVIQLQVGGILAQYYAPEAREKFLSEPGATVHRTVVGGEKNAVVLRKPSNSEISVVRDGIHYSFSHGHDPETLRAIELIKETARFPTSETASSELHRWSDPKAQAVANALRAGSPEAARDILTEAGAPGVRVAGGTLHDLKPKQHPSKAKRWWQFWK